MIGGRIGRNFNKNGNKTINRRMQEERIKKVKDGRKREFTKKEGQKGGRNSGGKEKKNLLALNWSG